MQGVKPLYVPHVIEVFRKCRRPRALERLRISRAKLEPKRVHQRPNKYREEASPGGAAVSNDNVPCQTARGRRGLPWAWIALSSLATFLWLVAIGWFAIQLFRWMVG